MTLAQATRYFTGNSKLKPIFLNLSPEDQRKCIKHRQARSAYRRAMYNKESPRNDRRLRKWGEIMRKTSGAMSKVYNALLCPTYK